MVTMVRAKKPLKALGHEILKKPKAFNVSKAMDKIASMALNLEKISRKGEPELSTDLKLSKKRKP